MVDVLSSRKLLVASRFPLNMVDALSLRFPINMVDVLSLKQLLWASRFPLNMVEVMGSLGRLLLASRFLISRNNKVDAMGIPSRFPLNMVGRVMELL